MNKQTDPTSTTQLIIKFLCNELNAQEQEVFDDWLAADPNNKALVESFRDTNKVQEEINYLDLTDANEGWAAVQNRIQSNSSQRSKWPIWGRYAAAAVFVLVSGIVLYNINSKTAIKASSVQSAAAKQDVMPGRSRAMLKGTDGFSINLKGDALNLQTVSPSELTGKAELALHVPKAGEYQMILPDGTKVWLNSVSTLTFPASFNKSERRVQLEGEAYFEVSHNKNLPFIVSVNDTEVKVLGTHFNIESYGTTIKTTLLEGAVRISSSTDDQKNNALLKPGQQATVQNGRISVSKTDTQKSIAWKEGLFYFKEDRINDILDQISRWYDVEIVYTSRPNDKRYDGTIRRQATLSQVLDMLNTVSGTRFEINGRTVTVDFN